MYHLRFYANSEEFILFFQWTAIGKRTTISSCVCIPLKIFHFISHLNIEHLFHFFYLSYPFISQYTDRTFLPCYIHLTHGGYCTAFGFNGVDSIFITACFHIAAQFQLTTIKFKKTFEQLGQNGPFTPTENQQLRCQFIEAMEDQIKLFELTDLFIEVFTSIILMHFISVAVIIGIGSIDFLIVNFNLIHVYLCIY